MSCVRIALLGILVTRVAVAGDLVSSGGLAIRAPDGLILGRDATATIRVHAEANLRLVTSVGAMSELVATGTELSGTLTLPTAQFPQVAIVAAIADDGTVRDWLAIPLAGQARVKVDTEPLANVVVKLGAREFGPVLADQRGVANVDIIVPPGISQALTVATGKSGAVREKALPLGVQPFARTLVVCGDLGDRVSVVATLANGAPATTAPKLSASTGSLTPLSAGSAGVFIATHRAEADGGPARITAAFPLEEMVAATCTLQVPPEPPSAIRIVADRSTFIAGTGALSLAIELEYPGVRRPLALSTIAVDSDFGHVEALRRTATGWTAAWTLPEALAGKTSARATVRARLPGGSQLTQALNIELAAAAPVRIAVSVPGRIRSDGAAGGLVVVRVVDRFDNAVRSPKLEARARGRVGDFATRPDGAATASYVTPLARDPGDDVIEVSDRASGLTSRTTIHLDSLPRRFAFSARVGYLSNLGRVGTPTASVSADARLPVLDEHLAAGLELVGYSTSFSVQTMDAGESIAGRISCLPALARVAYRGSAGPIDAWIGAGVGIAFASLRLSSPSSGTQTQSAAPLAATGFVGGALRAGPGWIVAEGGYLHATLPTSALIAGRIGGVVASVGFAFELR